MTNKPTSRRSFLKTTALAAPAIGFPTIVPSHVLGENAPSKKITVGMIGVGNHGVYRNTNLFLQQEDARIVSVCDVFDDRSASCQQKVDKAYKAKGCSAHHDFREILARKDIDTVMISTPDHWHVLMSVMAIRAGKDVICEKPTLTIAEGRYLANLVEEKKTVFQTSTEDRSLRPYHRMAELVRNGRIGKLKTIRIELPAGENFPNEKEIPVPKGLDYDLWLGPAPKAPYTANRLEKQHWRHVWDYSGGKFSDWGAHQIDTAQWANDTELTGPVEVEGQGTVNKGSMYNTFVNYNLKYTYANGVVMHVKSGGTSLKFEGTDGWVGNDRWAAAVRASSEEIRKSKIGPEEVQLFTCRGGEHRNFLDCVKSREAPYLPAEKGHRLATILHMGNIAMRLKRKLRWDPKKEEFLNDPEANAMRAREMRKPWSLEA